MRRDVLEKNDAGYRSVSSLAVPESVERSGGLAFRSSQSHEDHKENQNTSSRSLWSWWSVWWPWAR